MKHLFIKVLTAAFIAFTFSSFGQTSGSMTKVFTQLGQNDGASGLLTVTVDVVDDEIASASFSIERAAADQYDVYEASISGEIIELEKGIWYFSESGEEMEGNDTYEIDPCYVILYIRKDKVEVRTFECTERGNAGKYFLSFDGEYIEEKQ